MSSYATVYLSDGRSICSFRNGVDQLFFILFTRDDWIELEGSDAWVLVRDQYEVTEDEAHLAGFRTTVGVLRDRLDVLGVPTAVLASEFRRLVAERLDQLGRFGDGRSLPREFEEEVQKEIDYLAEETWDGWITALRSGLMAGLAVVRHGRREPLGTPSWLMSIWDDHDPRYQLRAVLEALPADAEITLDLADLLDGGWLDSTVDPRDHANELVSYASQGGLPPIVLTEGRFDAEVLSAALRLRRPHLVGYLRFPDFSHRPEGGAASLRQTVRAFAAAGIPNRVLALFDNDTAARDVLESFDVAMLPANLQVATLPALDLAAHYPTVGAQGEHRMDVNGLAASIEMYLGEDVLTHNGELRPVVWGGYFKRLGSYQGEILDKSEVQEAFRAKVATASSRPESMRTQDWSGLDAVLDHLLELVRATGGEGDTG